jgi:hypothetical protein
MGFRTSKFKDSQEEMFRRELDDPVGSMGGTGIGYRGDRGYAGGGGYLEKSPIRSLEAFNQDNYTFSQPSTILPLLSQIPENSILGNIALPDSSDTTRPPRQSTDKRILITQVPTSKFSTDLLPRPLTAASRKVTLTYDPDHPRSPPTGLPSVVTKFSPTRGPFNQNGFLEQEFGRTGDLGVGGVGGVGGGFQNIPGGRIMSPTQIREMSNERYTYGNQVPTRYTNERYSSEGVLDERFMSERYSGVVQMADEQYISWRYPSERYGGERYTGEGSRYTGDRYTASKYERGDGNGMMFRASELMRGQSNGAGFGGGNERVRSQMGSVFGRDARDTRRSSIWGFNNARGISEARVGKRYRGSSIGTAF